MLDISVLDELTAGACAAVTGRQDSASLLRHVDAANLFLVAADDERSSFRYHHLVRQLLRAELQARDRAREQKLQLLAAEWFETIGETRQAICYLLAARQVDRALALLQDRVAADFLRDPAPPGPLDLSMIDSCSLTDAPEQLLALAAHLLTWGDLARGGQYLDLVERAQSAIAPDSRLAARFATILSARHAVMGRVDKAVDEALAARAIRGKALLTDEWTATVPMILISAFEWLEDYPAVEREAAAALAAPELTEPVKLVAVAGARALAWFESGRLTEAADAAAAADGEARRLGFSQHFFAVDYLRALAGLALEQRDLNNAEQLTEHALSLSERGRPAFEFLVLLDRARIWAARGQVRDALATIEAARRVLATTGSVLLVRADELEALLRLSIGDLSTPVKLAAGLPAARHGLLLARVALTVGDHHAAHEQLQSLAPGELTPRQALVRQILLAAVAIGRGDPMTAGILGGVLESARHGRFLNTVVTTAPEVTSYLIEHSVQMRPDPFTRQLIAAALEVRAAIRPRSRSGASLPTRPGRWPNSGSGHRDLACPPARLPKGLLTWLSSTNAVLRLVTGRALAGACQRLAGRPMTQMVDAHLRE